jgi:hypothetical protein
LIRRLIAASSAVSSNKFKEKKTRWACMPTIFRCCSSSAKEPRKRPKEEAQAPRAFFLATSVATKTRLVWTGLDWVLARRRRKKETTLFWSFICPIVGQLAKGHFGWALNKSPKPPPTHNTKPNKWMKMDSNECRTSTWVTSPRVA